jgi:PKD repeat protein
MCITGVTAMFTSNVTCGVIPFMVQYNDTSTGTGITEWYWNFTNGNTSTEENVTVWYNVTGVFDVYHSATGLSGTDWYNDTNHMVARPVGDACEPEPTPTPSYSTGDSGGGGGETPYLIIGAAAGCLIGIFIIRRNGEE